MRCIVKRVLSDEVTLICALEHEHLGDLHHDVFYGLWWKEDESMADVIRIPLSPQPVTPRKYVYDGPVWPAILGRDLPELELVPA